MDSAWIIWYDAAAAESYTIGGGVGLLVIIGFGVGCLEGLLVVGLFEGLPVTGFGVGCLEGLLVVGFAVFGLLEGLLVIGWRLGEGVGGRLVGLCVCGVGFCVGVLDGGAVAVAAPPTQSFTLG